MTATSSACSWGCAAVIVCALTFVLFRVLPTGNPALLRAGRDPQPETDQRDRTWCSGLNKPLPVQFWDYMKDIFLHFNFGYSYYSQESVKSLIAERLPATLSLTFGAAVLWVVAGLRVGIISALRRALVARPRAMGTALVLHLGAGILARPGRAVPVRRRHRQIQDLPRSRQLRRPDQPTRGNGSPR